MKNKTSRVKCVLVGFHFLAILCVVLRWFMPAFMPVPEMGMNYLIVSISPILATSISVFLFNNKFKRNGAFSKSSTIVLQGLAAFCIIIFVVTYLDLRKQRYLSMPLDRNDHNPINANHI